MPNTGDELILASLVDYYLRQDPRSRLVVLGENVAVSSAFVEARGDITWVTELNQYFAAHVGRSSHSVAEAVDRLLASDLTDVFPGSGATVEAALRRADVFHVAGGGYFHEGFPNTIAEVLYCAFALERANPACRLVFTGLTLGPFGNLPLAVQDDLQAVMRSASLVDLRDERSTSWLDKAGIEYQVTCDDAFLAGWRLHGRKEGPSRYCLIHLGGDTTGNLERYERSLSALATAIREIAARGVTVVPISFCPVDNDAGAVAQALERAGHQASIVECSTLGRSELLSLFAGAEFAIGGRLHVAISAFIAGTPAFTMDLTDAFDRMVAVYSQMGITDLDLGGNLQDDLLGFVERCLSGNAVKPEPLNSLAALRDMKSRRLSAVVLDSLTLGPRGGAPASLLEEEPSAEASTISLLRHRGRVLDVLPGTRIARYALPLERQPSDDYAPRWGYSRPPIRTLEQLFRSESDAYRETLRAIKGLSLAHIPMRWDGAEPMVPAWLGGPTEPLDALAHYGLVRLNEPRRYVEIGSGMLTLFADLARRDGDFPMEMTVIDTDPRPEVVSVASNVSGVALESCDLSLFDQLRRGDVVFVDGSHRSFMNSDVTVFFVDVLPRLAPGVLVHVHDVTLPLDYPEWAGRWYWNEQYLLAVALIAGADRIRPILPTSFLGTDPEYQDLFTEPFVELGSDEANASWAGGGSLWFTLKRRLSKLA